MLKVGATFMCRTNALLNLWYWRLPTCSDLLIHSLNKYWELTMFQKLFYMIRIQQRTKQTTYASLYVTVTFTVKWCTELRMQYITFGNQNASSKWDASQCIWNILSQKTGVFSLLPMLPLRELCCNVYLPQEQNCLPIPLSQQCLSQFNPGALFCL